MVVVMIVRVRVAVMRGLVIVVMIVATIVVITMVVPMMVVVTLMVVVTGFSRRRGRGRTDAGALDVMMVARLRQPNLRLEAENLRAVFA